MGNLERQTNEERNKTIIKIIIIFAVILFFSIIFSLTNISYNKIHKNVYIDKICVSNMTQKEANEMLNKLYREKELNKIKLVEKNEGDTDDFEALISYDEINVSKNIEKAVDEAFSVGRTGNIITNNYKILSCLFLKRKFDSNISIDEDALITKIDDIEKKLPNITTNTSYYIDGDQLVIKRGKDGVNVNKDELRNKIINNVKNLSETNNEIDIPTIAAKTDDIDIEKIANEITKKPQDAYISDDKQEVHAEENGIELAVSLDEAKGIITSENKEEYNIPLKITTPSITVASLGNDAFKNKLATFTTNYDASNTNRNNNLVLAAQKLNGTIVNPGEEFSYNKTIGERTIAAGFKEAKVYANGDVVLDVGGGICQLSSTLYNACLLTNLDITERHNHYFLTSYVEAGRDATVSWGSVDFKFKNNRKYPIKISSTAENGVVTVDIYGIKQDDDCTVVIDSKVTGIIEKNVEHRRSGTARAGEDGATSETYKTLLKNGIIISKSLISKDTYNSLSQIIID